MKKPMPPNMASTTANRKKIDHPAASPPPSIMVMRQVEQAKMAGMMFMARGKNVISNVNASGLTIEANSVDGHHHRTDRSYNSDSRDHV